MLVMVKDTLRTMEHGLVHTMQFRFYRFMMMKTTKKMLLPELTFQAVIQVPSFWITGEHRTRFYN